MLLQAETADMHCRHLYALRHRPLIRIAFYVLAIFFTIYFFRRIILVPSTLPLESANIGEGEIEPPLVWEETAAQVRRAFLHAYHGYERYASPHDELSPVSNNYTDNFNGWGVSTFDSLDTMLIMDLNNEFKRATQIVQKAQFSLPNGTFVPFFETVIRYLGGLLSAYALSENQLFLDRADELATKLDPVFNTTSGLALFGVNPSNGNIIGPEIGILAEIASLQLEYLYLAKLTNKRSHFQRAATLHRVFENANLRKTHGMLPIKWNLTDGQPLYGHLSVGAQADSAHEYLLKQYLMTAKTDKASLVMYLRAITYIISNLLFISPTRHLLYVTDENIDKEGYKYTSHTFEHLSCFLPGLLALGVHTLPLDDLASVGIESDDIDSSGVFGDARRNHELLKSFNLKKLHLWAAQGLAQTCYLTYVDQFSGLGADEMVMKSKPVKIWDSSASQSRTKAEGNLWIESMKTWKKNGSRGAPPGLENKKSAIYQQHRSRRYETDYVLRKAGYLLRPETIESLYILWRVTGDMRWREYGWRIFTAIEREAKTPSGYASLRRVDVSPAPLDDDMPSYFLSETLKYLYLLFIDEDLIPLDKWVFNTEAHPFPVFEWTAAERAHFAI